MVTITGLLHLNLCLAACFVSKRNPEWGIVDGKWNGQLAQEEIHTMRTPENFNIRTVGTD